MGSGASYTCYEEPRGAMDFSTVGGTRHCWLLLLVVFLSSNIHATSMIALIRTILYLYHIVHRHIPGFSPVLAITYSRLPGPGTVSKYR